MAPPEAGEERGDLTVTALYTSEVWAWGKLPGAELLRSDDARRVFGVTNLALGVARLFLRGARSLRHSLLHRHLIIDHLLAEAGAREVLELAAGLSRRGISCSADPAVSYTEVDLPGVVARKRALLERSDEGRAALARPNLRLLEADVGSAALDQLAGPGTPLFVIAEGLLMYLQPPEQRALWGRVAALLASRGGGTFVFDLVPVVEQPRPGLAGSFLSWLMKRFTGGQTFVRDERSRDDVAAELRAAGFERVELLEPQTAPAAWALPFPGVPTQQLLFVCGAGPRR